MIQPTVPVGANNRLLLQLLLMQALQSQSQGQGPNAQQPSQLDQILGSAQKAKGNYDSGKSAFDSIKSLFGGGATGATASQAGNLSSLGSSATQAPGFSGIEEMVGNGLYSPGTPSLGGGMSTAPTAASGFDLAGIGSAGNYYLPAAGAIGTFDLLKNQRTGGRGYLQGAASGAAMGSYFGPWGAVIGAGAGLGMAGANELFDTNKFKTEGNRLQGLLDKGVNIPKELQAAMSLKKGRKKSELVNPYLPKDFVGNTPQYGWTNNKFAESRNKSDLRPEDIWGYSAFFDKYGNDWLGKFSEQQRRNIAQKALDRGAVKEHHGTIDINWSPELEADASGVTGNPTGNPTGNSVGVKPKGVAPIPANTPPLQIPVANSKPINYGFRRSK